MRGLVTVRGRMQRADRECLAYSALLCAPGSGGGGTPGDTPTAEQRVSALQLIRTAPCLCPTGKSPEEPVVASL